ncbi:hypothetical protein, partial [Alicyclobacillus suci]|uniref:hypothetical protein n=1 Tax=Alicyclobacillus suci TaxID=2816080 RepID=UPI001A8E01A2
RICVSYVANLLDATNKAERCGMPPGRLSRPGVSTPAAGAAPVTFLSLRRTLQLLQWNRKVGYRYTLNVIVWQRR